jgi:hypothetical protein
LRFAARPPASLNGDRDFRLHAVEHDQGPEGQDCIVVGEQPPGQGLIARHVGHKDDQDETGAPGDVVALLNFGRCPEEGLGSKMGWMKSCSGFGAPAGFGRRARAESPPAGPPTRRRSYFSGVDLGARAETPQREGPCRAPTGETEMPTTMHRPNGDGGQR